MKITIKPSDLIKRFIWDKYKHFCLHTMNVEQIKELIEKDQEFEISENDAFVCGLTNVIYTDEVIYKFKQFIKEILENKCFEQEGKYYITKEIIEDAINIFKTKIPKNWTSDNIKFNIELNLLNTTIYQNLLQDIDNLESVKIQKWEFKKVGQIKKLLKKIN